MKKCSLIILVFLLLLSTMSYSYANNEGLLSSINKINVIRAIDSITINWDLVNNVDYYRIVNEKGEIVYEGKENSISFSGLKQNSYYAYYLTGYNKKGNQLTERVSLTVKTKSEDGVENGFSTMIVTSKYVYLQWEPISNKLGDYELYRNGTPIATTDELFYKDIKVQESLEYSYDLKTTVTDYYTDDLNNRIEYKKFIGYNTVINLARINNSSDFTIQSTIDSYYPVLTFKTFIPLDKVTDPREDVWPLVCGDDISTFGGDARGFSYSSSKYRTYQRINIDFSTESFSYDEAAGVTHGWCERADGSRYKEQQDTALMDRSGIQDITFNGSGSVDLEFFLSADNPLVVNAPKIDANIELTLYRGTGVSTGSTTLRILHDGFPNYELYRKDGTLSYKTLYRFDAIANGQSLYSLFDPMEWDWYGQVN